MISFNILIQIALILSYCDYFERCRKNFMILFLSNSLKLLTYKILISKLS